ncbi:MAG: ATP-dependent Clp protease ATP-binding subunit [Candidatus Solibacter usitatus]|nr:ATP-dependent Clp protease ATP-binding subunit [Candidatus Solibacter usitatus]
MRNATPTPINLRPKRSVAAPNDLLAAMSRQVVGQDGSLESIVPYVQMYQAGLAPEGRPVGVFLLLGPTGTGKTRTVEALAEAMHGSPKNLLRIDCGEFQMEHEVAKLIGAPPGYLGHRETTPLLTQQKLNAATSERSNLSIILFDEIEKAALSLNRLLLGVLDKATLKLGDNTTVNFERSLIFLTSNLGARGMSGELRPDFGFDALVQKPRRNLSRKLESIAMRAVKKRFSPEFVNRVDVISTYLPLDNTALNRILDLLLDDFRRLILHRLGQRAFAVEVSRGAREFLLKRGTSPEYGARELKRVVHRNLIQPIAAMVAQGLVLPGAIVCAEGKASDEKLRIEAIPV